MTDHATRARELCTIGEHDGFSCLFIGGLPMYHAASIEQIGRQMDRLLPIIAAALASASQETRHEQNVMYLDLIRKLDAKDAQLQAAQPVWGTERPINPKVGELYMWREDDKSGGFPLHYFAGQWWFGRDVWTAADDPGCEWAGPLPLPREA